MKHEVFRQTTVKELIEILSLYDQNAFITINADGSSSFIDDGVTVESLEELDPPEVSIGADF